MEHLIVDIDGVLANNQHIINLFGPNKSSDEVIVNAIRSAKPIKEVVEFIQPFLSKPNPIKVVFCTGRPSRFMSETIKWLESILIIQDNCMLLMRYDHDEESSDANVKLDLLRSRGILPSNTIMVLDDKKEIIDHLYAAGYKCMHVKVEPKKELKKPNYILD